MRGTSFVAERKEEISLFRYAQTPTEELNTHTRILHSLQVPMLMTNMMILLALYCALQSCIYFTIQILHIFLPIFRRDIPVPLHLAYLAIN